MFNITSASVKESFIRVISRYEEVNSILPHNYSFSLRSKSSDIYDLKGDCKKCIRETGNILVDVEIQYNLKPIASILSTHVPFYNRRKILDKFISMIFHSTMTLLQLMDDTEFVGHLLQFNENKDISAKDELLVILYNKIIIKTQLESDKQLNLLAFSYCMKCIGIIDEVNYTPIRYFIKPFIKI